MILLNQTPQRTSAMETGNHFKNGASLKSLMSKGKQYLLFFMLLLNSATMLGQNFEWALKDVKSSEPFHDGLASFYEYESGLYGAIDRSGQVIIKPQFKSSFEFENGFAVVETETGKGIINRSGLFLLEPVYKYILPGLNKIAGLYTIVNTEGKEGVFYNNRLVLPVVYKSIYTDDFPFISIEERKINLIDGKIFDKVKNEGAVFITEIGKEIKYYNKDGEEINSQVSSKGVQFFKDEQSEKYGFKNIETGAIITSPIYDVSDIPIFVNNVMIVSYRNPKDNEKSELLIDANGKEVIKRNLFKYVRYCTLDAVLVAPSAFDTKYGLYSITGKQLLPAIYGYIYYAGHDCFIAKKGEEQFLYNFHNGKLSDAYETIYPVGKNKEGMIKVTKKINGEKVWGYVNSETMKEIPPQFGYTYSFSEGLAVVQKKDTKRLLINKNGEVIMTDEKFYLSTEVNNGVLGVKDKETLEMGYIYVSKDSKYTYNQTNVSDTKLIYDVTVEDWLAEGHKYFEKEKYATAKEYYYKVMMAQPKNIDAIISYGACLGNLGYYEEALESCNMALDIDPNNKIVLNNVETARKNMEIERQNAIAQQNANNNRSSTFWDALSSFGQVLYDVGSAYNSGGSGSYGSGGYSDSSGSSGSSSSCASYKQRYNDMKYKRDREANGNAGREGTATGKNKAHSIAPDKASGATSGDYRVINGSRALIREYERQMQSIERQAKQAGCSVY
ncbi:MAG: WG repeat-containing protein [Prevotellaceae bacterium]|jgi:hypothetical protein|nr:WG repeat-containing protein [Prevotellaceae bacterium]